MRPNGNPTCLREMTTLQGPGSRAVHSAWSPGGEHLAVAFADGSIRIWPQNGGDVWRLLEAPAGRIEHVAWSPDGRYLAAGRKGPVLLWEVESGQRLPPIEIGTALVTALAWEESGESLVLALRVQEGGTERFSLRRFRRAGGVEVEEDRIERECWDGAWVAMSSDRSLVALVLPVEAVELWDLRRMALVERFAADYVKPYGMALSPGRDLFALSYRDGSVWMWHVPSREPLQRPFQGLQIHEAQAYSLDFSCDRSLLASKAIDGTVCIRLVSDWCKGTRLAEPSGSFESEIAFHPHRLRLATYGNLNTTVRLWDVDLPTLKLHGGDDMITIRFFSASPGDAHLDLEREMREIQDHLAFAKQRDRFDLQIRPAARPDDLIRFLTQDQPRVVHFSGHGSKRGEIIMLDRNEKRFPVSAEALAAVFRLVSRHVQCVILNACYAETQARAISEHVEYVVGMHTSISDDAAIAYSKGFYQSLGNGVSFEEAHEFGKAQIALLGMTEEMAIPVLLRRADFQKPAPAAKKEIAPIEAVPEAPEPPVPPPGAAFTH